MESLAKYFERFLKYQILKSPPRTFIYPLNFGDVKTEEDVERLQENEGKWQRLYFLYLLYSYFSTSNQSQDYGMTDFPKHDAVGILLFICYGHIFLDEH